MQIRQFNNEVFFTEEEITKLAKQDIDFLKGKALFNSRKRIRLCAHQRIDDEVHEMLIIHAKDVYVRPHKHLNKSESFHLIEGLLDVVIFDEVGNIKDVIKMGNYSSGEKFFYRLSRPYYHSIIIKSDFIVFHEATKGPFNKADTIFAPWSPEENDEAKKDKFIENLKHSVENFAGK